MAVKQRQSKILIVFAILIGLWTSSSSLAEPSGSLSEEAIAKRLSPVGHVRIEGGSAKKVVKQVAGPAKIYKDNCQLCHARGLAGAPKLGDKAAWKPRLEQGLDTMVKRAWNGFKAMPPKGNCMNCSEDDLRQTIQFMLDHLK
jgi:cytochrome c5